MARRLAAVLSLDFLLISPVSHFDTVYFSVLHKKQASFFFYSKSPISTFIHTNPSNAQQLSNKQLSRLATTHTHNTHELMSTTEAVSTLQLAEYCFGQIEELMRKKNNRLS